MDDGVDVAVADCDGVTDAVDDDDGVTDGVGVTVGVDDGVGRHDGGITTPRKYCPVAGDASTAVVSATASYRYSAPALVPYTTKCGSNDVYAFDSTRPVTEYTASSTFSCTVRSRNQPPTSAST